MPIVAITAKIRIEYISGIMFKKVGPLSKALLVSKSGKFLKVANPVW